MDSGGQMVAKLGLIALVLMACSQPVFNQVQSVTVREVAGKSSTVKKKFPEKRMPRIAACLAQQTTKVSGEGAMVGDLLPSAYLIEVKDADGSKSFELLTKSNLTDGKGGYYHNPCIHELITKG